MTPQRWFLLVSLLLVLFVVVGCGGAPATPTKPAVTVAPAVTIMVVTATPAPVTPTTVLPTALPTPIVTATVPVTTPVAVKPTSVAVKVPTRTPTKPAATTGPTALPQKFAAPTLLEPIFNPDQGKKDERHFPGDALIFKWGAVGGMGGDECYLITVSMTPGQSDSFLADCGDQTQSGYPVSFILNQPNRGGPNYSALLPNPNADAWVSWTVTAVKSLGKGTGPQDAGGNRFKTAPLGPTSGRGQFLLKGQ